MSKLISVAILCDCYVMVGDEQVLLRAGTAPDLDAKQAAELLAAGNADDNPQAIAAIRGKPLPEMPVKKPRKAAGE